MTVYKGFQKGLICRGYQFHLGKNVTEKADCGEKRFHCAEDPETGKILQIAVAEVDGKRSCPDNGTMKI